MSSCNPWAVSVPISKVLFDIMMPLRELMSNSSVDPELVILKPLNASALAIWICSFVCGLAVQIPTLLLVLSANNVEFPMLTLPSTLRLPLIETLPALIKLFPDKFKFPKTLMKLPVVSSIEVAA